MKKLLSVVITAMLVLTLAVSASAADLSEVLTKVQNGESTEGYLYENYLTDLAFPDELAIEFTLEVTDVINPYATIFCFHNGDGNARFCFTMGGGIFYNDWAGSWMDAGLHNGVYDNIFEPYIGSSVQVKMVFDYETFGVYLDGEYAYGNDTLNDRFSDADAFYGSGTITDFWGVSSFICQSAYLDFGYNSWWTNATLDRLNAGISDFAIYFDGNLMAKYFVGGEVGVNEFFTSEDYEIETEAPETDAPETEAPETEAPVTTDAPETEAPTVTTEAPTTENTDEGGCGASVAAAGIIVAVTATLGCALTKRSRKDN